MISFFRRFITSKVGVAFMLVFLGVIAFAFVAGDLSNTTLGGATTAGRAGAVATVGGDDVTEGQLSDRIRREYEAARRQQPDLTFETYLAQGGLDSVLTRMLSSLALDRFARAQGMTVSTAAEVAQIQQMQSFRGLDGNFDRAAFDGLLRQLGMSEAEFRSEIAREMLASQVLVAVAGAASPPDAIVRAQANLLLEGRTGSAAFVPASSITVPAPTPADLQDFYRRNIARYTVPERRVARYALVDRDALPIAAPTEAQIAAAYRENAARYAATETRTLSQVILPTEAAARTVAERVRGGTPLAAAASAAGVEPATLPGQTRDAFARLSSAPVAAAAFAAPQGGVTAPARSGLGWHVVRVDAVDRTAGRSLDQARAELTAELTTARREAALGDVVARVQDEIGGGATFEEAAAATGLRIVSTPALLPDGREAGATATPQPLAVQVARAVFGTEPDADPVVQEVVPNQTYALVAVAQVVPAAAPPLAQVADRVTADLRQQRVLAEARRIATDIARRANGPTSLSQALSAAGRSLAVTRVEATRQELAGQVTPQTAALFSLRPEAARAFEAADRSGWYVVHLDEVRRGNAANRPDIVAAAQNVLTGQLGQEYAEQFVAAARAAVGVTRNEDGINRVRASLSGGQ
ncbi:peptidyl-prolyl cis-trans isomerase D [Sphingomonas jejuensis]|uniref:Parvulin-like PPIase n=1 Tax=Sphingomonas jejuensis TaxID=904715 RepID=A0ABX0XKN4_9SPHN|nr:peptidylprolyl isomerase [Sphingomonas jejuensis]NJC33790.1 peptidyl-prolyl cis-trans isomerase D [Sphingomonas jejuensis]